MSSGRRFREPSRLESVKCRLGTLRFCTGFVALLFSPAVSGFAQTSPDLPPAATPLPSGVQRSIPRPEQVSEISHSPMPLPPPARPLRAMPSDVAGDGEGSSPRARTLRAGGLVPPIGRPLVIMVIGDSITYGLGDDGVADCTAKDGPGGGFCALLARARSVRVINEGVCGDNSFGGRSRIRDAIDRWRPEILLILYSHNDRGRKIEDVIDNLQFMITTARERAVLPLIGTLTPVTGAHRDWEPFVLALNTALRRLAEEQGIELADHYAAFTRMKGLGRDRRPLLASDGLHPTGDGYRVMAATWDRAIHRAWGLLSRRGGSSVPPPR